MKRIQIVSILGVILLGITVVTMRPATAQQHQRPLQHSAAVIVFWEGPNQGELSVYFKSLSGNLRPITNNTPAGQAIADLLDQGLTLIHVDNTIYTFSN